MGRAGKSFAVAALLAGTLAGNGAAQAADLADVNGRVPQTPTPAIANIAHVEVKDASGTSTTIVRPSGNDTMCVEIKAPDPGQPGRILRESFCKVTDFTTVRNDAAPSAGPVSEVHTVPLEKGDTTVTVYTIDSGLGDKKDHCMTVTDTSQPPAQSETFCKIKPGPILSYQPGAPQP